MNQQRVNTFLSTTSMTPMERQAGRFLRAPDHGMGGEMMGMGGNNGGDTGGNNGDSGTGGDGNNNDGQGLDAEAFWQGSIPGNEGGSGNGSSGAGGTQGSGTQGQGGNEGGGDSNVGTALAEQLSTLNFGNSIMTPEVVEGINNGNFEAFNNNVNGALQSAVRNSLLMSVQVMREYGQRLQQQILSQVNGNLEGREDHAQLVKDFPAAANPKVAPLIQQTFAQALKNTNGDRGKAIQMTKQMLDIFARTTAPDLNLNVAPVGSGDSLPASTPRKNWLEELAGRDS